MSMNGRGVAPAPLAMLLALAVVAVCAAAGASVAQTPPTANAAASVVDAAIERTSHRVVYDGSYRPIDYPGGDVPDDVGVCTDLVVRSYRAAGIDLQQEVHEDMARDFSAYPRTWGLQRPDSNIDHRRVPNLQTFFRRRGAALDTGDDPASYRPGDLVTWILPGNLPHIGIVVDRRSADGLRPLIVHNIGQGPKMEDVLFAYEITGHYRFPVRR
jgi:uncharacterized protein YijF (DUF1287 family)